MEASEHPSAAIEATFKRAVAILDAAGIPFLLGGSLASWAYGGAQTRNDLDLMVKPQDAERALQALVDGGMKPERPPEEWLLKAWDGDVLVDLIHHPTGFEISDEVIERGEWRNVAAMRVRVMSVDDVMVSKLRALGEHNLDLSGSLQIARALRERIDWEAVRARTSDTPYARAFLTLAEDLGVAPAAPAPAPAHSRVRVVE
jgi:hypothetical protein